MTNMTPVSYINIYRVNAAVKLLQNKKLTILEISLNVGFDNVSYFIKMFKKYKHYSPAKFRQQQKIGT